MLEDHQRRAIRALARFGSFREAADHLAISPASFSRHIKQAERAVGMTLFDRQRNGVRLTTAGREVLRLLDDFDGAVGSFEVGLRRLRDTGGDYLRIGCGPLPGRAIVSPILAELLRTQSGVRVAVRVDATKAPIDALRRGELDIALCDLTHTPDMSDLDLKIIAPKSIVFVARPDHPIHEQGPVELAAVLRLPMASPYLHKHWRVSIARILGNDEAAWETVNRLPVFECDDYALLTDLTGRTNMVCGGVAEAFAEHESLGLLRRIDMREEMTWNICAARRKGGIFPAQQAFWDAMVDLYAAD
ncbi:LysR family transcriptional regulator [Meridianimarinicoccus aquatilis]|uniref:LysR family transcriptional regulator n=1 Tax=Meridianimarinicoccus aquatilis TaxID=2552766 RepID=A0A4R6AXQ1_9RHOB|nr:LysR family transcriptional regulator [Fluviibacterium aquatile]TDL89007.1 LysR family transcriptional regulator [Fluviibacterium aquatile]